MGKKSFFLLLGILAAEILNGCGKPAGGERTDAAEEGTQGAERETVSEEEERQILEEVTQAAFTYRDLYLASEKGQALNAMIGEDVIHAMAERMAQAGYTVTCDGNDRNMDHWETLDGLLAQASEGKTVSAVFYSMAVYGGLHCYRMDFSGREMELTTAEMDWSEEGIPYLSFVERLTVHSWEYTEKGWLIWEKEPSKNMEMDRHGLFRVKPLDGTARKLCETYVEPVGYGITNLFLTDWSSEDPADLALNDTFGILYYCDKGENPPDEAWISAEEWEAVMTDHLPFSREILRQTAVYDAAGDMYAWQSWGYGSGTALPSLPFPEVVSWEERGDQIWILEVEAVSKEEGTDCAFAHEVTVQIREDGSGVYLSNRLIPEKKNSVPRYRMRSGK